ncbi:MULTISPECIES: DUF1488 family protein [Tenebrionibacter/Tenebrionicola group]|jgi:hypothetical protein|uniref:DUF1488 domain-containing protein n=2 Tax=Tenebrionibacter/Tenebrionicola group TaxID=2969848 RepID=A0A8K0V6Y3_9ENTR|nr:MULTISPECIES: DUF1488 domain-containing protein [Tenebrionibacter/Tenebrionicola group]MBK4716961.1 DUF1488 domain-containing protein [Tenebrionibacter intestinalis]MBV4413272.1 DUF1488 domain-containing protein [Tenebrionicola larvae]MBV5097510.1 DUF1488 domain-containing protein [Tenebrionicola larvae]
MNQSVHFPDRECWDERRQAVCFPALVGGMQLTCAIKSEALQIRYGVNAVAPLALFRQHRWDLEEEAQQRIRNQEDDETGWLWLP